MKATSRIWCEAQCVQCGAIANNSGIYSAMRIKALKNELKNWEVDQHGNLVCDLCIKENNNN